jgi:hypothetical protein
MKEYGEVNVQSHIFLTSALIGGGWSASHPGRFTPRYPLDRRLGGPQSQSRRREEEKILDPTRTPTPTPRSSSQKPVAILMKQGQL